MGGPGRAAGTISTGETEIAVWPQSRLMQQAVWIHAGRNESVLYWGRSGEALSRSVGGIVEAGRVKSNQGRTGPSGPSPARLPIRSEAIYNDLMNNRVGAERRKVHCSLRDIIWADLLTPCDLVR